MKKEIEKQLTLLGLHTEAATIYQTLCSHDLLTLAGIAKQTGLYRQRLYSLVPELLEKGVLEEHVVGKRTLYRAVPPKELLALWQEQTASVVETLDTLQATYEDTRRKPTMQFYTGKGGYTKLFDDIADSVGKEGTVYRYSARKVTEQGYYSSSKYRQKRDKGKIDRLIITNEAKATEKAKTKRLDRSVRVIPQKFDPFDDNVSQLIYDKKVAFIDHEAETTFIIDSPKIASLQKKLFQLLWRHLKEV